MNPTPERLEEFKYNFLYDTGANLDLEPQLCGNGTYEVALHAEHGNEIDAVHFDDSDTATRFIDWLINLAEETKAVTSRTFTP